MKLPFLPALATTTLICCACSSVTNSAYLRRTAGAANDHIMVVRSVPPTFGSHRLAALAISYPDLGEFLRQSGDPDFLAETQKGANRYLILYYMKSRKAFACRTGEGSSRQVEFSGPYPITDSEARTLRDLRDRGDTP